MSLHEKSERYIRGLALNHQRELKQYNIQDFQAAKEFLLRMATLDRPRHSPNPYPTPHYTPTDPSPMELGSMHLTPHQKDLIKSFNRCFKCGKHGHTSTNCHSLNPNHCMKKFLSWARHQPKPAPSRPRSPSRTPSRTPSPAPSPRAPHQTRSNYNGKHPYHPKRHSFKSTDVDSDPPDDIITDPYYTSDEDQSKN